jgi:membrane protease YdiL (CAAX protease family)
VQPPRPAERLEWNTVGLAPLPPPEPRRRREKAPWGLVDVVLVIVVGLVLGACLAFLVAVAALAAIVLTDRALSVAAWFSLIGTALYAGFAIAVWALIVDRRRVPWSALGVTKASGWLLAVMVPAGVGLLIANVLVLLPLTFFLGLGDPDARSGNEEVLSADAGLSALDFILIAIPLVVAAPIVEELVFRGVLYRYLRGGLGVLLAVLLSALVFAVLHVVIPPLFLMGIVLAALAQRTNSLLPGIVLHATNNGLIVLAIWAASRSA